MTTRRWKCTLPCLILALPMGLHAQGGAQGPRDAQGQRVTQGQLDGFFPWWDSPIVNGLDLTDSQRTQIRSVIREYRGRMVEVRSAVQKAETELDEVFNEDTVDQRRGSEAIDRLTKARADMTKSVSEMSLRMRALLTPQQWQELRQRQASRWERRIENAGRGSGTQRSGGRVRRVAKDGAPKVPPRGENPPPPPPPAPALTQQ